MAVHIRNLLIPSAASFAGWFPYLLRELFIAGRWTEVSKDADSAFWTSGSNLKASFSNLSVNSGFPTRVVDAGSTGLMSSTHVGLLLTISSATNDVNRGVFRITNVVDSNTLTISPENRVANWTTEASMAGRIVSPGQATLHTNSYVSNLVMTSNVSGGNQARMSGGTNLTTMSYYCYPKGDSISVTSALTFAHSTTSGSRVNAYFDTTTHTAIVYYTQNSLWAYLYWGQLGNTRTGDTYPRFMQGNWSANAFNVVSGCSSIYMLDNLDNAITGFVSVPQTHYDGSNFLDSTTFARLRTQLWDYTPWAIMPDTTAGGYRRGTLPFTITNTYWEAWRPLNSAKTKRKSATHIVLPMNGATDPIILV